MDVAEDGAWGGWRSWITELEKEMRTAADNWSLRKLLACAIRSSTSAASWRARPRS